MRKSNFALRLQPSLLEEARRAAEAEGVVDQGQLRLIRALKPLRFLKIARITLFFF